ncbi:hypothetical protein LY78DRAFT_289454 [Colletotrichum sublineola]|nr:hypothetical protein LY78DRAFT_289454 [Colletotrichum sublineola]
MANSQVTSLQILHNCFIHPCLAACNRNFAPLAITKCCRFVCLASQYLSSRDHLGKSLVLSGKLTETRNFWSVSMKALHCQRLELFIR